MDWALVRRIDGVCLEWCGCGHVGARSRGDGVTLLLAYLAIGTAVMTWRIFQISRRKRRGTFTIRILLWPLELLGGRL